MGVACVYDTVGSETPGEARHRRLGELEHRTNHYQELYRILQTRPEHDIPAILHRIRAGVDVEDVVRFVREGDILIQLSVTPQTEFQYTFPHVPRMPRSLVGNTTIPYMNSLIARRTLEPSEGPHSGEKTNPMAIKGLVSSAPMDVDIETWRSYRIPYHAVELVDPRLSSIKASRWTAVTSDDTIVQKLLEAYFLFDYTFYAFLHKDLFLDDLIAGRERYCSSLLVNALLAQACVSLMSLVWSETRH